jgi:DNA invertase Pin-like site-specific DNA recombinase
LKKAGCKRVFTDQMSGARADRPGPTEALSHAREGDLLVVWRLDRLGRSLPNLIEVVADLEREA